MSWVDNDIYHITYLYFHTFLFEPLKPLNTTLRQSWRPTIFALILCDTYPATHVVVVPLTVLCEAPADPILGLVSRFKADPAKQKAGNERWPWQIRY